MKFQVFGCPNCQQPFQVAESQAGQLVQCPSCSQTVEIPANAFEPVSPPPTDQQVYSCPKCDGQFGVTLEMFGHHVGCPHCQNSVLVQSAESPADAVAGPVIKTDASVSRKKKKPADRWKSKSRQSKDLFAPGTGKDRPAPHSAPSPETDAPALPERQTRPTQPAPSDLPPTSPTKKNRSSGPVDELRPPPRIQLAKPGPGKPTQEASPQGLSDLVPPSRPGGPSDSSPQSIGEFAEAEAAGPPPQVVEVVDSKVVEGRTAEEAPHSEITTQASESIQQLDSIDHLLPPRFDVLDPTRFRLSIGKDQFKVLLPDGEGGTKQVDQRVIRVDHEGEQVSLVALTDREKRRRRLIQNIVAIVIGIIIMAIAFSLLR